MLIAAFLCTVTNAYLNGVIKTFVGLIIYVFRFKILFKIEYSKSVLLTAVCIMTLIIPDSIETIFVTKVLNVDKLVYYNEIAGTIYSNFVVSFGLVIIGLLFRKKISKIIKKARKLQKRYEYAYVVTKNTKWKRFRRECVRHLFRFLYHLVYRMKIIGMEKAIFRKICGIVGRRKASWQVDYCGDLCKK